MKVPDLIYPQMKLIDMVFSKTAIAVVSFGTTKKCRNVKTEEIIKRYRVQEMNFMII